jgi:hypothetical protein
MVERRAVTTDRFLLLHFMLSNHLPGKLAVASLVEKAEIGVRRPGPHPGEDRAHWATDS